ncbi:methionyl-tRNA formyltransferase, partial [Patescibacteria group bacterium]|nr:methionyl-tRNA formyltransferase [Patescibacteria group bacterium]
MKIAFLGVPDFGTYILEGLIKNGYEPIVLDNHEKIKEINPDLTIVASYGKIIPENVLNIPKYGTINIHPSLLPKYRGASPIQTTILNGDKVTGISIMLMDKEMDHGGIVSSIKYKVLGKPTYKELEKKLAEISIKELIEVLPRWIAGEIKAK